MFFYASSIKLYIEQLGINEVVHPRSSNKPYIMHALVIVHLLNQLDGMPLLEFAEPFLRVLDNFKKNDHKILEQKSILENLNGVQPLQTTLLDVKDRFTMNEIKSNINELCDINISSAISKMHNIHLIIDGHSSMFAEYSQSSEVLNLMKKSLLTIETLPLYCCYNYSNLIEKDRKTFTLKYKNLIKKTEAIHYSNNTFHIHMKLSALAVLARKIIIIALIKMLSKQNGLYLANYPIFTQLIKKQQRGLPPKTLIHYRITLGGQFTEYKTSDSIFKLIYGFCFEKIETNVKSRAFSLNGQTAYINILDISHVLFPFSNDQILILNKICSDLSEELYGTIENSTITPKIDKFLLLNAISNELSILINNSTILSAINTKV